MEEQLKEEALTTVEEESKISTFIIDRHPLDKIAKLAVSKFLPSAMKSLSEILEDDKVDQKTKVNAAKALADASLGAIRQVDNAKFNRQLAQMKLETLKRQALPQKHKKDVDKIEGSNVQCETLAKQEDVLDVDFVEDQMPTLDFENIQEIS